MVNQNNTKLEIWGSLARNLWSPGAAARKSHCECNLASCRACKNLRGRTPKGRNIVSGAKVHLGGSICMPVTFFLWAKVHHLLSPNDEGL